MRRVKGFVIWAGLLAGLATRAEAVRPGDAAPEINLTDTGGTAHTLSAERGKVVLLAFIGYS